MRRRLLLLLSRLCPRGLRLRIELDETNRLYRRVIAEAERKNDPDKLNNLYSEWHSESAPIEEELLEIQTRRLVNKARRMLLPVPDIPMNEPEDENWIRGTSTRGWHLKAEGVTHVRAAIRAESKERREALIAWATLIIGILGALTGLVAVWRR
jgi:hypothetical protein